MSVTLGLAQVSVAELGVSVAVGAAVLLKTVAVAMAVAVQPTASATMTEYVPGLLTTIELVVAPVEKLYELPPPAVSVTLGFAQVNVAELGISVAVTGWQPGVINHDDSSEKGARNPFAQIGCN